MTELAKVLIVAAVFGIIAGLELVKIIELRWDIEALSARLALRTEERDEAIKALGECRSDWRKSLEQIQKALERRRTSHDEERSS